MNRATLAISFAALVAALLIPRRAKAATAYLDDFGDLIVDVEPAEMPSEARPSLWIDEWKPGTPILELPWGATQMPSMKNVDAFLYAIRHAEHSTADANSGAAYRVFYGGSRFSNLSDHPVNTGEKKGVPLPADWCKRLGYTSGRCVSTAAGAYQFIKPTWDRLRAMNPRLPDFSPASQDEAARRLLAEIGALDAAKAGDWPRAIALASKQWASLPGSTAGQSIRPASYVLARINEYLGTA